MNKCKCNKLGQETFSSGYFQQSITYSNVNKAESQNFWLTGIQLNIKLRGPSNNFFTSKPNIMLMNVDGEGWKWRAQPRAYFQFIMHYSAI